MVDLIVGVIWLLLACAGLAWVWSYATHAEARKAASHSWPTGCSSVRYDGSPALVMFLHPRCPCSRATLGELALIMAKTEEKVSAQVWFYRPQGAAEEWAHTDLWRTAKAIPGLRVDEDEDGVEAAYFNATISGQTIVYSGKGKRLFDGGITAARGHSGDNAGHDAVMAALRSGEAPADTETPVFGCSLVGQESPSPRS